MASAQETDETATRTCDAVFDNTTSTGRGAKECLIGTTKVEPKRR
jgi:hypothetical protein